MSEKFLYEYAGASQVEQHIELINKFLKYAQNDNNICALGIGGSFAHGTADQWSDVDLFVIVPTLPANEELVVRSWADHTGEYQAVFSQDRRIAWTHVQIIFVPFIRFAFRVYDYASLEAHPVWASIESILDKEGKFTQFLLEQKTLWTKTNILEDLRQHLNALYTSFWIEYARAYKYVQRGEIWSSIYHINGLREILLMIIRIANSTPSLYFKRPYKRIEAELSEIAHSYLLVQTLPTYSSSGVAIALYNCVLALEKLTPPLLEQTKPIKNAIIQYMPPASLVKWCGPDKIE